MRSTHALAITLLCAIGATTSAYAAGPDQLLNGKSPYGTQVADGPEAIKADLAKSRYLNVRCGDTVTFVRGDRTFSWKFESLGHRAVPLSKIAPAGFAPDNYMVYVARNEGERGA